MLQESSREGSQATYRHYVPARRQLNLLIRVADSPGVAAASCQLDIEHERDGGEGDDSDSDECRLCGTALRDQLRHHCQDCATQFCPNCIVNALLLHSGHTFQAVSMQGGPRESRQGTNNRDQQPAEMGYECSICLQELLEDGAIVKHIQMATVCVDCVEKHPKDHLLDLVQHGKAKSRVTTRMDELVAVPMTIPECVVS